MIGIRSRAHANGACADPLLQQSVRGDAGIQRLGWNLLEALKKLGIRSINTLENQCGVKQLR